MEPIDRPLRVHPRSTWVGLLAVLFLAVLPLLAASTFSAPAAQGLQATIYLPLVERPPYRIAFVSWRDGNEEIYAMNADGSDQTNLTKNPKWWFDRDPAWSPDGRQIAFMTMRDTIEAQNLEIYAMNADGSNQINLTNNPKHDFSPAWSPR